jgi:hypothetical protein
MSAYAIVRALHVITAVITGGLFAAIPIAAGWAKRTRSPRAEELFAPLFLYTRLGLVILFLSAITLEILAHGIFHTMMWFRASGVLVIVLFAMHARTRALAKRAFASDLDTLASVQRWGWWMCALVALLAFAMSAKPW